MAIDEPEAAASGPQIVDPHNVRIEFVDWVVTGGSFEEVVNITLGAIDHSRREPDNPYSPVVVGSRLRMSRAFAERLHQFLGSILQGDDTLNQGAESDPSLQP